MKQQKFRTGEAVRFETRGHVHHGVYIGRQTPTRSSGSYFLVNVEGETVKLFVTGHPGRSLRKA